MRRPRPIVTLVVVAAALAATTSSCASDPVDPLGSPSLPASGETGGSPTPGQSIWVAILAEGAPDSLRGDLRAAQAAVGDYLAERILITEPSCYDGLDGVEGPAVVAVQDVAEHGVHAMYLEVTDEPLFYGQVTLRC